MSVRLMSLAFDTALPCPEKIVLLALADHANDEGRRVYPAVDTLARKCGIHVRSVQRILRRLELADVIRTIRPGGSGGAVGRRATEYGIVIPKLRALAGADIAPADPFPDAGDDVPGFTWPASAGRVTGGGADWTGDTGDNGGPRTGGTRPPQPPTPPDEPPTEPPTTRARAKRGGVPSLPRTDAFDAFMAAYPKPVGAKRALLVWHRINPSPELVAKIMAGLEQQTRSERWQKSLTEDGGTFIPNPDRWLDEERWNDRLPERRAAPLSRKAMNVLDMTRELADDRARRARVIDHDGP